MEEWRTTTVCDRYEVSNLGRVRHKGAYKPFKSNMNGEMIQITKSSKILKITETSGGYRRVMIARKQHSIHRLVAEAFIPNPENKPQVNHVNGDKTNNCVENLEWCTGSENIRHRIDVLGVTTSVGENHPGAKLDEQRVLSIRERLSAGEKGRDLAKEYNVVFQTISDIKRRKLWKHI
jgi:hypothetical protein